MRRIAVLYDDSVRGDTTGIYCLRALQELQKAGALEQVRQVRHRVLTFHQPEE